MDDSSVEDVANVAYESDVTDETGKIDEINVAYNPSVTNVLTDEIDVVTDGRNVKKGCNERN